MQSVRDWRTTFCLMVEQEGGASNEDQEKGPVSQEDKVKEHFPRRKATQVFITPGNILYSLWINSDMS